MNTYPYLIRYTDFTLDTILLTKEDGARLRKEIDDHDAEADISVMKKMPVFQLSQAGLFGKR